MMMKRRREEEQEEHERDMLVNMRSGRFGSETAASMKRTARGESAILSSAT